MTYDRKRVRLVAAIIGDRDVLSARPIRDRTAPGICAIGRRRWPSSFFLGSGGTAYGPLLTDSRRRGTPAARPRVGPGRNDRDAKPPRAAGPHPRDLMIPRSSVFSR